jgi:hypothetical protein
MSKQICAFVVALTLGFVAVGSVAAQAQARPKITSLGPDFPKTEIFIGNSFFYYNNSMHSHVLACSGPPIPITSSNIARPR